MNPPEPPNSAPNGPATPAPNGRGPAAKAAGTAARSGEGRRVLVVDDAVEFQLFLRGLLQREGFEVHTATNGEDGLSMARRIVPHVVVLDLVMPGLDGIATCRALRRFSNAWILVISGFEEDEAEATARAAGADDFLSKPFLPRALVEQLQKATNRTAELRHRNVAIDVDHRLAYAEQGEPLNVSADAFAVLAALVKAGGRPVSGDELAAEAGLPDASALEDPVAEVRKALAGHARVASLRDVGMWLA